MCFHCNYKTWFNQHDFIYFGNIHRSKSEVSCKTERRSEERTCYRLFKYLGEFLLPLFFILHLGHEAMDRYKVLLVLPFSIKAHLNNFVMMHMTHTSY